MHSYQASLSSKSSAAGDHETFLTRVLHTTNQGLQCVEFPRIVNGFYDHVSNAHEHYYGIGRGKFRWMMQMARYVYEMPHYNEQQQRPDIE